jgi:hypothetical protein
MAGSLAPGGAGDCQTPIFDDIRHYKVSAAALQLHGGLLQDAE